jgi:hypothetical protein
VNRVDQVDQVDQAGRVDRVGIKPAPSLRMTAKSYRELVCWQLSEKLRDEVLAVLARPALRVDRRFYEDCASAARSAASNISEGFGRSDGILRATWISPWALSTRRRIISTKRSSVGSWQRTNTKSCEDRQSGRGWQLGVGCAISSPPMARRAINRGEPESRAAPDPTDPRDPRAPIDR